MECLKANEKNYLRHSCDNLPPLIMRVEEEEGVKKTLCFSAKEASATRNEVVFTEQSMH